MTELPFIYYFLERCVFILQISLYFPPTVIPSPSLPFLPLPLFFVKFTYGRVTLYCTNVKSVKKSTIS